MSIYKYPLELRFKLIALAPRIIVTDSTGQQVAFVHQKAFKLKEDIRIYSDESKSREIYRIGADKILDISAKYNFTDATNNQSLGYVQPKALRSIWRSTYVIYGVNGSPLYHVKEDNPWVKIGDALLSEVPVLGLFTGYFLNPSYTAYRGGNEENTSAPVMKLTKQPAFFESVFTLTQEASMTPQEETSLLLAILLMIQFQRRRG
jgi:hypothetical protein